MKVAGWIIFGALYAAALITGLATMTLYEDGGGFAAVTYIFYLPAVILAGLVGMGVGLASKRAALIAFGLMALVAVICLLGGLTAPYAKNGDTLAAILEMWVLPPALAALLVGAAGVVKHR